MPFQSRKHKTQVSLERLGFKAQSWWYNPSGVPMRGIGVQDEQNHEPRWRVWLPDGTDTLMETEHLVDFVISVIKDEIKAHGLAKAGDRES